MDEKSLSPGVLLVEPDEETGEGFKVLGDVDYGLPELNTKKDTIICLLNSWRNISPSRHLQIAFLDASYLQNELEEVRIVANTNLQGLKSKGHLNKVSITRETSNLSIIESCQRDVLSLSEIIIKMHLIKTSSHHLPATPGADFMINIKTSRVEYADSVKPTTNHLIFPTNAVHNLMGLGTIAAMKQTWKSVKTGQAHSMDKSDYLHIFTTFLNLYDEKLEIVESGDIFFNRNKVYFKIEASSFLKSKETNLVEFVYLHCDELNNSSLLNLMTQMALMHKPGLVSCAAENHLKVYKIEYDHEIDQMIQTICQAFQNFDKKSAPKQRCESMKGLNCILSRRPACKSIANYPLLINNLTYISNSSDDSVDIKISKNDSQILNGSSISSIVLNNMFNQTLKKSAVAVLPPAQHILFVVVNSIYGRFKESNVGDIPVFWCRTGKGYSVKNEIKKIIDAVTSKVSSHGIKVVCKFGDTAFHNILAVNQV